MAGAGLAEAVHAHSQDDDNANDDFLHVGGPAHLVGAVAQDGHDDGANHGAHDAAGPAAEAGTADDHGGDDVQLQANGDRGVALGEAGQLHHAGDSEKDAGHGVDADFQEAHADAAQARGGFVGADGKGIAAENRAAHDDGNHDSERGGDPDAHGEWQEMVGIGGGHEVPQPVGGRIDRLAIRQPFGHAAGDAHHAEGDDEGHHAERADDDAIDDADARAHGEHEEPGQQEAVAVQQGGGPDDAGEGHDGADAQIDPAAHDDERHAQAANRDDDRLGEDDFEIGAGEEVGADGGVEGEEADDEQQAEKGGDEIEEPETEEAPAGSGSGGHGRRGGMAGG